MGHQRGFFLGQKTCFRGLIFVESNGLRKNGVVTVGMVTPMSGPASSMGFKGMFSKKIPGKGFLRKQRLKESSLSNIGFRG